MVENRKCKNTTKSLILGTNFSFIFEQNSKNKTLGSNCWDYKPEK